MSYSEEPTLTTLEREHLLRALLEVSESTGAAEGGRRLLWISWIRERYPETQLRDGLKYQCKRSG